MSAYEQCKDILKSMRCPECGGLGEQDDLELGDIAGKVWVCPACAGSGFKDKIGFALICMLDAYAPDNLRFPHVPEDVDTNVAKDTRRMVNQERKNVGLCRSTSEIS